MPVGTSNPHGILLHSQIMNRCDGLSKSTHSAADTNDDNCNKIEPFEYELQVDTSSEKKQDWSFTLYDFDGNGKITKEELSNLFQALYDAVGSSIHLPLNGTKKIKLRLSIGHDSSHVDKTLKDQSPLLVKKKAKLKNTSKLTEWKEMSLQAGASQVDGVAMVDSKEYTKLNNLDASPRTKPSPVCKMENQLTPAPPGIGHRLTLSCKEQKKLTEMVHENMVRNQVRQQTGRKHHHTGHRHHHLHREARRHRSARRHGDENRKPREKDGTHYLDVGGIERSSRKAVILPYSAGVPNTSSTTTATVTTTSVMTFARPVINIVPSSSSPPPPPPPPPTASGSTAHCNEIGMAADDDDDVDYDGDNVAKPEVGDNITCRKHKNTSRETRLEENVIGEDGLTVEISGPQDHRHLHHQPRHLHHHHHHHRHRRHHLHRSSGDGEHAKCKHCPDKCSPFNTEHLKSGPNVAVNSEPLNKSEKKEILNRRHKHSNNTSINANSNNNNNNNDNNDNEIDNNCTEKDVSNKHMNHQLPSASGLDMTKQENIIPTYKCHNSNANTKTNFNCVCSRCQKRACQVRVKSTGSLLVKCENELRQRKGNTSVDGQETTPETRALNSATANTVTTGTVVTSMMPASSISASSPCEKKTTERSSKRTAEERYKKHNEGHHHAPHSGRTRSQDCGVEQGPAVSTSVSAVVTKMTAPGATSGSIAERKSLRTHHKNDSSPQRTSSRHRTHCQNTLVPEKHAGGQLPSAILHPPVSPPPPAPTPTAAVGVTPSMATTTTTTSTTLQQHHHHRRRNQASRNKEFNEAMQQVADWVNREHNPQAQQGPANDEHLVHVQRHEHHHVHEYHHHHHYHHYYQT